ncbi:MAG: hypothetical protein NT062_12545 [Proteobacteria bacterium]|nr:hypothetical protein [Pseudomonadota bacterium]
MLLGTGCGAPTRPDVGLGGSPDANGAPDADPGGGGGGGGGVVTYVYAHTASALYQVDPDTLAITQVGDFGWPNSGDQMTDIAIDKDGVMVGMSYDTIYRIDPTTAQATQLSTGLTGQFNGLSFVPAAMVGQTGADILVGTRAADGGVFRIDPMTGATTQAGNMGNFSSSGDLVSVTGLGTLQTATGASNDRLVRLAAGSFAASAVGSDTGFVDIWGIAYWKSKVFGFTSGGQFITIDPNTGVGTLVQGNGPSWWGAAVTTAAPVIF